MLLLARAASRGAVNVRVDLAREIVEAVASHICLEQPAHDAAVMEKGHSGSGNDRQGEKQPVCSEIEARHGLNGDLPETA